MKPRRHKVGIAFLLLAVSQGDAARSAVTSTVYVGPHFEVRERDQPVKYVFNRDTRVARITGSLSAQARLQRLRLRTGWNLVSLAVTAPDLLGQFQSHTLAGGEALLRAAYRWQPSTADYRAVETGETVAGGTVLWLHARTNRSVAVRGGYIDPVPPAIPFGGAYVPGPGLEVWPLQLPAGVTVWKLDAGGRGWQAGFAGDLAPLSDVPSELAPGEAIYLHSSEAIELSIPDPELRVAYYHQDHLGSSSVITGSDGELVEETAFYPFGAPRHQHRTREARAHYGFTQKEQDRESGLHYFEARYLVSPLARFLTFDPMLQRLETLEAAEWKNLLRQPAKWNPFVYALNNPVRYVDPDGRDARPRTAESRPRPGETKPEKMEPELTIRIGPASTPRQGELAALSLSMSQVTVAPPARTGADKPQTTPLEFQITRQSDKASPQLFRKSLQGEHIKSVKLILPGRDGKEIHIHLRDVHIGSMAVADDPGSGKPLETMTLNAATMHFEGVEPLTPAREPAEWTTQDPRNSQ